MSADILLLVNETSPVVERIPSGKQSYRGREREGLRRGRKGEREGERERWERRRTLPRRQKIINYRTAGHYHCYRLQDGIDVTQSCIDSIDGRRAASNNQYFSKRIQEII
jgi:hypothetical protein